MRAILIDPVAQTITEIETTGTLEGMREAIASQWIDIIGIAGAPIHADLVIDDEGRLASGQRCFHILTQRGVHLIAGRALIVSHDAEGDTIATLFPLEAARALVRWCAEGTDYTPEPPLVVGFKSEEMMKFFR